MCAGVLYCPPVISELFSVNFLRGLNEEIMLIFLVMGDFDCRIGEGQMELLHFLDAWKNWKALGYKLLKRMVVRTRAVMLKKKT